MKKIILFLALSLGTLSPLLTQALTVTQAPNLKSSSNTSLTLEWDPVEGALGYYVYYDTRSWVTGWYENEGSTLIEDTTETIQWLTPGTEYFVALTVVDDAWKESSFSPESSFTTPGGDNSPAFALSLVEATWPQELTLTFSADLDTSVSAQREFIILNSVTEEELYVESTQISPTSDRMLVLSLDRELILQDSYDFTILSIVDSNGRNIESGIDAITNFTVPSEFIDPANMNVDFNSAGPEEEQQQEEVVAIAEPVPVVPQTSTGITGWNTGTMISNNEVQKNTEVTAETTEKLPQTGAEHVILLLIALLLGLGYIWYGSRKKLG